MTIEVLEHIQTVSLHCQMLSPVLCKLASLLEMPGSWLRSWPNSILFDLMQHTLYKIYGWKRSRPSELLCPSDPNPRCMLLIFFWILNFAKQGPIHSLYTLCITQPHKRAKNDGVLEMYCNNKLCTFLLQCTWNATQCNFLRMKIGPLQKAETFVSDCKVGVTVQPDLFSSERFPAVYTLSLSHPIYFHVLQW